MTTTISPPLLQVDLDHAEQFSSAISSITVDPIVHVFFYIFPCIQAYFANYFEVRENDIAQEAMMPAATRASILREIRDLTHVAGVSRKVIPYTTLNHTFSSSGGSLSLTSPVLFIPYQHLFRSGKPHFTQETEATSLSSNLWNYSDDETRFLIARELGHIQQNGSLFRIAIKIAFVAVIFLLYAVPIGLFVGTAVVITAIGLHLLSERCLAAKMDRIGLDILSRKLHNQTRAKEIALSVLDKMVKQNLARRKVSPLCRLYITASGNNLLDITHPFLTSRIKQL